MKKNLAMAFVLMATIILPGCYAGMSGNADVSSRNPEINAETLNVRTEDAERDSNGDYTEAKAEEDNDEFTVATNKVPVMIAIGESVYDRRHLLMDETIWALDRTPGTPSSPKIILTDVTYFASSSRIFMAIKNDQSLWGWG